MLLNSAASLIVAGRTESTGGKKLESLNGYVGVGMSDTIPGKIKTYKLNEIAADKVQKPFLY